jgi:lysophospholipase L1-like esterase
LFIGGLELVVRAKGVRPWNANAPTVPTIEVEPGGKFFRSHPHLGYTHIPGTFSVTLRLTNPSAVAPGDPDHLRFAVTHLPNTLRITRPVDRPAMDSAKPDIWIFGCSFTHGWSVNDNETYPWLLQERMPEYNVVNYGVSGYGTIHSLLQFREALKTRTPRVAVLAYANFHDERNTFERSRRKIMVAYNKLGPVVQPYARLDRAGRLEYFLSTVVYPEFPLMRHLALSHFIEMKYDEREPRWLRSHQVSEALITEMAREAKAKGVTFVVANINGTTELNLPAADSIPVVDIALDPTIPENTNLPFDAHPSATAHAKYAARLEAFLKTQLATHN